MDILQADEELYHGHLQMIGRLLLALKTTDEQSNHSGALPAADFKAVLTQFFPLKLSEFIEKLVQAAAAELNVAADNVLLYENLFTEVMYHLLGMNIMLKHNPRTTLMSVHLP